MRPSEGAKNAVVSSCYYIVSPSKPMLPVPTMFVVNCFLYSVQQAHSESLNIVNIPTTAGFVVFKRVTGK